MVSKLAKISPFAHGLRVRYLNQPNMLQHLKLFLIKLMFWKQQDMHYELPLSILIDIILLICISERKMPNVPPFSVVAGS